MPHEQFFGYCNHFPCPYWSLRDIPACFHCKWLCEIKTTVSIGIRGVRSAGVSSKCTVLSRRWLFPLLCWLAEQQLSYCHTKKKLCPANSVVFNTTAPSQIHLYTAHVKPLIQSGIMASCSQCVVHAQEDFETKPHIGSELKVNTNHCEELHI